MDINFERNTIIVSSREPFGKLLLETMHSQSLDKKVLKVQRHVGAVLVGAYLDSEIDNIELFGIDEDRTLVHEDVGRDLAIKSEIHARVNDVHIEFFKEHFDGLVELAMREIRDLPVLMAEKEVVSVAADMGYVNQYGHTVDDQDVMLIEEEIEQAEASKEVVDAVNKLRNSK